MPRNGSGTGEPPATTEVVIFPSEILILDAISSADAEAKQQVEQLNLAAGTAVAEWLIEQGIDPDNPPAHWQECPQTSSL